MPTVYQVGQKLSTEPVIYMLDHLLSPAEANQMIAAAADKLQPAKVTGTQQHEVLPIRTGSTCWLSHDHTPVFFQVAQRVSQLVGRPLSHAEAFQMIYYAQAQEYRPHYDAWKGNTSSGRRNLNQAGQRLVTCLIYLNRVAAGGGTAFPNLGLEVAPETGRMLVFHNCYSDTNLRHPDSKHAGLPVETGEKWAVNLWFRERPYP